jgi:hypothetical protein
LALALAVMPVTGCRLISPRPGPAPQPEEPKIPELSEAHVDPLALRADVDSFAFIFRSEVSSTATEMAHAAADRGVRESAIRWKIQVIPAVDNARLAFDPRTALAGLWAVCVRQRALLAGPFGDQSFGAQAATARQVATDLEARVVELAGRYLPPERVQEVSAEMQRIADEAPTIAGFEISLLRARPPQSDKKGDSDPLHQLLQLPMMPLAVAGAIGDTPQEIRNFANVTAAIGATGRNLPEQLRWQMELLMLESEAHPISQGIGRVGAAAESIARTADGLEQAIDRADGPLNTAHQTVRDAINLADKVDATTARAQEIVGSLTEPATALTQTASAWESTVHAVHGLLDDWEQAHPPSANPDPGGGFDVKDVAAAADQTRAAVSEARALISDVQSADLQEKIRQVSAASNESIDRAASRLDAAITKSAWAAAGLIVLAAGVLTLSRILVHHFTRAAPWEGRPPARSLEAERRA